MKRLWLFLGSLLLPSLGEPEPVIFRVSDPIGPGETVLLFGDGVGEAVKARGWRLVDEPIAGPAAAAAQLPAGDAVDLLVLQASELSAKVLLPDDWQPGCYVILLENNTGSSEPVFVNRTEAWWWLGGPGDVAIPGEEIRVFGKNLGARTRAWLAQGNFTVELAAFEGEKYAARFKMPADLVAGDYELWTHNGYGGASGFAAPLAVRVAPRPEWPTDLFDVHSHGAVGDGEADDTNAFRQALTAAGDNGGGIVWVPRGTYKITGKLPIPPSTILRGERREWVWLYVPKEAAPITSVIAGHSDFAVEELSIVSQTARRLVVSPDVPGIHISTWGIAKEAHGRNVRLSRLRLQHLFYAHRVGHDDPRRLVDAGPPTVVLVGPDMTIEDCAIVSSGMPFDLAYGRHNRIERNRLDIGRNGWNAMWRTEETVIEGNEIQGRDLEANYGGAQQKAYRLYFANNYWHDGYGADREALTFDTPYLPVWMGQAEAVDGRRLRTRGRKWMADTLQEMVVMIAGGKGVGQYIQIESNSEEEIILERPWAVEPDSTSVLAVRVDKSDVVITRNRMVDASVAVQLYAMSYGFIVDGNRAERTGGMYAIGWDYMRGKERVYSTAFFNQFLDNELSEGFVYQQGGFLHGILGPSGRPSLLEPPVISVLGNVVRNNRLQDNHTAGLFYLGPKPLEWPDSRLGYHGFDNIIEGNEITDGQIGIDIYPRYKDTLVRDNAIEGVAVPLRDDGIDTWLDPGERLAQQVRAAREMLEGVPLGGDEDGVAGSGEWPRVAPPSEEPAERYEDLRGGLWREVARRQPQTTAAMLQNLVGLRHEVDLDASTLAQLLVEGEGGEGGLAVRLRTPMDAPALDVSVAVAPVDGWRPEEVETIELQPGVAQMVDALVAVRRPNRRKQISFDVVASLADASPRSGSLSYTAALEVPRWRLRDWAVVGPFARAGSDGEVHGPELGIDLNDTYAGVGGQIGWQPLTAPRLVPAVADMAAEFTAYAAVALRAVQELEVELQLRCRGEVRLWLGEDELGVCTGSTDADGIEEFAVRLEAGDTPLLCRLSAAEGDWALELHVEERLSAADFVVQAVPAVALRQVEALAPPAREMHLVDGLVHDADLRWYELYADDFSAGSLGPHWKVASGDWRVIDGVLVGGEQSFLAVDRRTPAPVRIEYDARSIHPRDLSAFFEPVPGDLSRGYLIAFAGQYSGGRIELDAKNQVKANNELTRGVPGQWHHVIAQILADGTAQLFVDGQKALEMGDAPVPRWKGYPGVWTWGGGEFDNVRFFVGE